MAPQNESPVVALVVGPPGTGKCTMINKCQERTGVRMTVLTPHLHKVPFDQAIDWEDTDCVVVDDVNAWDRASIKRAVPLMEQEAIAHSKKMVLVLEQKTTSPTRVLRSPPNRYWSN